MLKLGEGVTPNIVPIVRHIDIFRRFLTDALQIIR
jgi:hypothetical protein